MPCGFVHHDTSDITEGVDEPRWRLCEEMLLRLQLERQALQKRCAEWLHQLERVQREQLEEQRRLVLSKGQSPSQKPRSQKQKVVEVPQEAWQPTQKQGQRPQLSRQSSQLLLPLQHMPRPQLPAGQPRTIEQLTYEEYQSDDSPQRVSSITDHDWAPPGGVHPDEEDSEEERRDDDVKPSKLKRCFTQAWDEPSCPASPVSPYHPDVVHHATGASDTSIVSRYYMKRSLTHYELQGGRGRQSAKLKQKLNAANNVVAWSFSEAQPLWQRIFIRLGLSGDIEDRTSRMSKMADELSTAKAAAQSRRLYKILHSTALQTMFNAAILCNAIWIGFTAQQSLDDNMHGRAVNSTLAIIDLVFCCWFALELCLRLAAERSLFIFGPDVRWNILDSLLVISSIVDLGVNGMEGGAVSNMTTARILRIVRFIRLFRMAHAVRECTSFRVVVLGILESMMSLYWCFIIVGFIIYMYAVFFMHGVTEYFRSVGGMREDDISLQLQFYWGSMRKSMITLFMVISGGVDWVDAMKPLGEIHWFYEQVFLFYIFFMFFAVLNVVIGTFVATTSEIQSKDRETVVKNELNRFESYAKKIKEFFHEADTDKSGRLTWEEFEAYLRNNRVKAYFQALELDVSQAHALFKILDTDGTDDVGVDEFVEGCMRLKNQAKSLDIKLLMYQNELVFSRLKTFMEFANESFANIERKVTSMQLQRSQSGTRKKLETDPSPQSESGRSSHGQLSRSMP